MKNVLCTMFFLLALLGPAQAFAGITMFASPDGDEGYILEGDNAQGVEAIDISIGYNTATLANPRVETTQGGTVTDVYAGTPGMLNVTVTRENPDSAFELHLKFDKKGDSPGVIDYVSATARGKDGKNYAASSDLRALTSPTEAKIPDSDSAAKSSAAKMLNTDDRNKSVLQRFREFKGERGLKAFAALFDQCDQMTVQEPAIALSDGKTPVVIKLKLQTGRDHSPDIALLDAKLVSLQRTGEKNWVITAVPSEGAWGARMVLGAGKEIIDFPLVVAPPVKIADGINDTNFLAALNSYLSDLAAIRNGNSERYRDEYIFTANYLAHARDFSSMKEPR